ncbi:MAG: hypothetical protein D6805_02075 [Planctomycetota bacterium]|nr:MAG: hypothetical protein D6805_02075 [Planctomycetota bacterium]
MKKLLPLLTLLLWPTFAYGEYQILESRPKVRWLPFIEGLALEFSVPIITTDHDFDSTTDPKLSLDSVLAGTNLGLEYKGNSLYLQLYLNIGVGEADSNLDVTNNTGITFDAINIDSLTAAGVYFLQGPFILSVYTGVGVEDTDYEYNDQGDKETISFVYVYFPIGAKLELLVSPNLKVAVDFTLRFLFAGEEETDDGNTTITADLEPSVGVKVSFPLDFILPPFVSLSLTPWLKYQPFQPQDTFVDSEIFFFGVNIGIKFYF